MGLAVWGRRPGVRRIILRGLFTGAVTALVGALPAAVLLGFFVGGVAPAVITAIVVIPGLFITGALAGGAITWLKHRRARTDGESGAAPGSAPAIMLVLCLTAFACRSVPDSTDQAEPADVVGCYVLETGAWSRERVSPTMQTVPERFALTNRPAGPGRENWFLAEPGNPMPGTLGSFRWAQPTSDSVVISYSPNGLVGVSIRGHVHGDSIRGTATAWTDAVAVGGPPLPQAPVLARRQDCAYRQRTDK